MRSTRCPFRKSCASALLGAPGSSPAPEATLERGVPREHPGEEVGYTMIPRQVVLNLWLGLLTLLWTCQPLLLSQARGIVVLALFCGVLAVLGGLTSVRLFVVWSGGIGLLNLTLALLLTAAPANLWVGLSAGLTLLALLDGHQCVAYLRHCQVGPGVVAALGAALVRLSGLSLAAGLGVGLLVTALHAPGVDSAAAGYMTIVGAGVFVGCFAAFLLATSRWSGLKTQDEWGEKDG